MSRTIPRPLEQRLVRLRDEARRLSLDLQTHAQDVMAGQGESAMLPHVQLVRAHVDAATIALEHAVAEASAQS